MSKIHRLPIAKRLPYLLLVARHSQFNPHKLISFTELTIHPFLNQDRFYRCISKYDPSCAEAIDNGDSDLDCDPYQSAMSQASM